MSQQLLQTIVPQDWEKEGSSFSRVRWLQDLSDLVGRPVNNRVTASTNATAVALNGAIQSTGVGTIFAIPGRYAEFLVQARATFNISGAGTLYLYLYRTTGAIPANGAAPGAGDVIVGGDAFGGPATVGAQNVQAAMSFFDSGLNASQSYRYYFAVKGTNALTGNLINASQIVVSEL